jgi:K+-transporting ATPase ATPase C chain
MDMFKQLKYALFFFAALVLITGVLYPLLITGVAQLFFPHQANGSLIKQNGQVIGSELIGQYFNDPAYFWGRPSATTNNPYNASASGASNFSVMNNALLDEVKQRLGELKKAGPLITLPVPVDLVTSSGSGLDPDISIAAALFQAERVAKARNLPLEQVISLINNNTQQRSLGFLGEPVVNVLKLNLALDALQ